MTYAGPPTERQEFDRLANVIAQVGMPDFEGLVRGNSDYLTVELYDPLKGHRFRATDTPAGVREKFDAWLREKYDLKPNAGGA